METGVKSRALEQFQEVTGTLINSYVRRWKDQGGRVIGYFCTHVPDEVITAAGMLPFRMRATGSDGTELSDAFFSSINCSFPRHCFNMALRGEFEALDGLIVPNSCDHVRRIYDNWKRELQTGFVEVFSLPKKSGEPQVGWYRDEVRLLIGKLEKHFGVKITDEALRKAIRLHNENRRLLRKLYELRKAEHPPITGAQTLAVVVAGTAMPRDQYNALLKELLNDLQGARGIEKYRARLMVVGGILDDPEYIEIIEGQGGLVVTDFLCFGTRLFWADVPEEGDPVEAIARYQVQLRPTCPRIYGDQPRRKKFIQDMVRDFKVDGVIGERLLFCDPWVVEHYMNDLDLKEAGIPFLKLDREYVLSGKGQIRTRVQAFLEMLGR